MKLTGSLRNAHVAVALLGSALCLDGAPSAENGPPTISPSEVFGNAAGGLFNPRPEVQVRHGVDAPNACASGYGLNEDSRMNQKRTVLQVPRTDSKPVVDGKLDELCWKNAAKTGPLAATGAAPARFATNAFLLRDADHLYVGVICAGKDAVTGIDPGQMDPGHTSSFTPGRIAAHATGELDKLIQAHWAGRPAKPSRDVERVELLIDSNGDRNSYYRIRITPKDGGKLACSYNEHTPPWRDLTWQPQFMSAVAKGTGAWAAEFALPLNIFFKNKTLASQIGFNICRAGMPDSETHCWQGTPANLDGWAVLTGIPSRTSCPKADYANLHRHYGVPPKARRSFFAEEEKRTIPLGPGSSHAGTTGEVMLELEGFLLAGDPHARGIIWDLAVDERKGELFVLSDPRPVREAPELRVFDRHGKYLRTIMPLNPNLPRSTVHDLCRKTAREGGTELVIPEMFETLCGSLSMYGAWWNLPQKIAVAPNGDLIMSNIYRGVLWRMKPDGSLPPEGWTSIYHPGRNEPFESTDWTQGVLLAKDLKNYMPYPSLRYPYFCFGRAADKDLPPLTLPSPPLSRCAGEGEGTSESAARLDSGDVLYVSAGQSSLPTRRYAYFWEVSAQEASYHWDVSEREDREGHVWKCQMQPGVKIEEQDSFSGFAEPSGLALDGDHLIVADAGNNRLQVLEKDGRLAASITHFEHAGKKEPLNDPTALAIDRERNL